MRRRRHGPKFSGSIKREFLEARKDMKDELCDAGRRSPSQEQTMKPAPEPAAEVPECPRKRARRMRSEVSKN